MNLKSLQGVADTVSKIMNEKLHPNQQKQLNQSARPVVLRENLHKCYARCQCSRIAEQIFHDVNLVLNLERVFPIFQA